MATAYLAPVIAAAAAGVAGFCAFSLVDAHRRRSAHAHMALQEQPLWCAFGWARNGVRPMVPFARWCLKLPGVASALDEAVHVAEQRGVVIDQVALLSGFLTCGLGLAVVAVLVTGTPVFSVAVMALLAVVFANRMTASREARLAAMRQQTPEALRALGVCSKSGLSLAQTMDTLSVDLERPIAHLFEKASSRLKVGVPASEALAVFSEEDSSPELSFVAVALDVRHQTGGSLSHVLESARESVRDELDLRRSLQVQTAQAQLSARIVTCMPFVLVALFSLITEDFMAPFFQSVQGVALLMIALIMQAAGVLAVRSLLRREAGQS